MNGDDLPYHEFQASENSEWGRAEIYPDIWTIIFIHGSLNVPIEHHPTIRYMVYNGYYNYVRWCPIFPKWDSYQPLLFTKPFPPPFGSWYFHTLTTAWASPAGLLKAHRTWRWTNKCDESAAGSVVTYGFLKIKDPQVTMAFNKLSIKLFIDLDDFHRWGIPKMDGL